MHYQLETNKWYLCGSHLDYKQRVNKNDAIYNAISQIVLNLIFLCLHVSVVMNEDWIVVDLKNSHLYRICFYIHSTKCYFEPDW